MTRSRIFATVILNLNGVEVILAFVNRRTVKLEQGTGLASKNIPISPYFGIRFRECVS